MKVKTPPTHFPMRVEEAYKKQLNALVDLIHEGVLKFLDNHKVPYLQVDDIYAQGDLFNPQDPSDVETFKQQLDEFVKQAALIYGGDLAKRMVEQMIKGSERMANNIVDEQLKAHSRVQNIEITDDELKFLQSKAAENMSYISSIGSEYLNKVQDAVMRHLTSGNLGSSLAAEIMDITDVSKKRANLIARDQTAKVFGEMTKYKQKKAGISYFRWSTALDERVRPRHRPLEGKIFSWDDGWGGIYPGDEINCRCVADPVFEDELDEADPDEFFQQQTELQELPAFRDVPKNGMIQRTKENNSLKARGAEPNEVIMMTQNGAPYQKRYFDAEGRALKDIDYTDHFQPAAHPVVPHVHDWDWDVGGRPRQKWRKPNDGEV